MTQAATQTVMRQSALEEAERKRHAVIYTRLRSQATPACRVGFMDSLQQALNFELLAAIDISPTATVLDVGCGRGDLYAYLQANGYRGRYSGLDIVPHMVAEAQDRFPDTRFVLGDILTADLEPCDYALASGIFDYRTPNSAEGWAQAITRMYALARRGIAWNGLRCALAGREDLWVQPLPAVLALCESLGPYYAIRSEYDHVHFTAYVYRPAHFYSDNVDKLIGYIYLHPDYAQALQSDPQGCAAQFGVSLLQLSAIESLWVRQ
jgi:SAM-dependent methyltransferase